MKKGLSIIILMLIALVINAQKSEIPFDIIFKEEKIGAIKASEEKKGNQIIKDIKNHSSTKVMVFEVYVESELLVIFQDGALSKGTAYRHASRGSSDVHAYTEKTAPNSYRIERNGTKKSLTGSITWCIADLYFREPKGLSKVYSNMLAEFVNIKPLGNGKYETTNSEKKKAYYTYKDGKLINMEVETPIGKVVALRK